MRSKPLMQNLKPRWHEVEKQLEDDSNQENNLATCQNRLFFRLTASRYESLEAIKLAIQQASWTANASAAAALNFIWLDS